MAHLQRQDEADSGDIVRSWDAEADGFPGGAPHGGGQSFRKQTEEVLDLLRRRKWLILWTCLVVLGGAALYTYTQVPVYSAESLVLVGESSQAVGMPGGQASSPWPSAGHSLENELVFLRNSQSLKDRVAQQLVAQEEARRVLRAQGTSPVGRVWQQMTASVAEWADRTGRATAAPRPDSDPDSDPDSNPGRAAPSPAALAAELGDRVAFTRVGPNTNVIRVTALDESPGVARLLSDLYTEAYVQLTQESSRSRVRASRQFLQKRSRELEQELEQIEGRIQAYQRREDAISLDQRESALTGQIADTETQLEQARIEMKMERSSLQSLRSEMEAIQPDQLSERVASTVKQEIEALQTKIADLELSKQQIQLQAPTMTRTDSVQAGQIDRRIAQLRGRIATLSDKYVSQVMAGGLSPEQEAQRVDGLKRRIAEKQIAMSGLASRIKVLTARLDEYEQNLDQIPEKAMELAQLRRDQRYAERMYGFVTEQLQQVRVQEKSELGYATRVAEATTPQAPVRPQPGRNLLLGLVVGLLGGGGLALVRDQMDNRLYKPDQIRALGARQVGLIPNLDPLIDDELDGNDVVEWEGHTLSSSLVGILRPHAPAAEAYRKVWAQLRLGRAGGEGTALLVTSAGGGAGKSTTASNLAIVAAQEGRSTLLVDADLRRARLHQLFDVPRQPGITEALRDDLSEASLQTPLLDTLFVLPAGQEVKTPTEVLRAASFRAFLNQACEHFDHVIVDSSPVLATADGPLLSDLCDSTLCVARAGVTTDAELEESLDVLHSVNAEVAGVVLNGFDISMAYGYTSRYRQYGAYGPYDQYRSLPDPSATEG
jgi:capsular exopolysaccharide synthesis family protein